MERLGLEVLDLYLIHWMTPAQDKYVETWKAFAQLQAQGRIKSIGISNFTIDGLNRILDETGVVPVIHQVETHPYLNQAGLRAVEADHGILHESWSPLGQGGELLPDERLVKIAAKHDATVAQVVIAWHLALGNVVIPKSVTESRIRENFAALDLTLDIEDLEAISGMDRNGRIGPDPATANFT
jgi:2,5-diketo-D-gluconate reductase A